MLIWRGAGILVVIFWILASLLDYSLGNYFGQMNYADTHPWLYLVRGLIAGIMIYGTSSYLEKKPGRSLIDKVTGEEVIIKSKHDLFYIPLKHWSFIVVVIGLVLALRHN